MNFLEAVNRVLRTNSLIKGDDDDINTFSDVQHNATLNLAMIAIQDELNDLVSDSIIPYEFATGTITTDSSNRTYVLASDFVRFFGDPARFYYAVGNRHIYEIDRNKLSQWDYRYQTTTGEPNWWYFEPGTTKRVGFYQRPTAVVVYTYDYEKSVAVTNAEDTIPMHNEPEAQAFCQAAGRRFKALYEENKDLQTFILKDPTYITARARLANLKKGRNAHNRYAAVYR